MEKSTKWVYIYPAFERFWHWAQMVLIFFLAFTGFEIHGTYKFFGFESAVTFHIYTAYSLLVLTLFAIFWHLATGEWRNYIPTPKKVFAYVNFYLVGIFKNAPHPTNRTFISKLNPLQKVVYFGLKIVIIPLIIITGILYLYYRFETNAGIASLNIVNLQVIAYLHTLGAYLILAFIIAHIYLTTTGHTIFSNINAMLTGYEELEMEDGQLEKEIIEKHKIMENNKE